MALLIIFGFVAGAGTALSPCVLPVLPIALSAGATGGRRRPLGIVAGLTVSFTFATVALVYVIAALGLPDDFLRKLAIAVLLGFGVVLMVPRLAARIEATMSGFAGRFGVFKSDGEGFWSGTAVGASLGLLYAPCAGPILAGVITVSASQSLNAGRLAVALSYGVGSAVVLYFLMLGGRRVVAPLARRGVGLQIAMGAVMVVVALAMLRNYDVRFQNSIASDLPAFLVNPTESLEDTAAAQSALADLRGGGHGVGAEATTVAPRVGSDGKSQLPVLGEAPEFVGNQQWFNTPGDRPLTLRSLRGRVVLVDFWTYSCINCIRTFPYLKAWDERYRKDGLTIVGVHTPEFPFERVPDNVAEAIESNEIRYPVAQDNEQATWNAYGNQYWPAEYFIDAEGRVRYAHFGEGAYDEKEAVIRELLAEAGRRVGSGKPRVEALEASAGVTTPETYLGAARAERFTNPMLSPGLHAFRGAPQPSANEFAYRGRWRIDLDSATAAGGSSLDLNFGARRVYLVLGSPGKSRRVRVLLDGKPISGSSAGADVRDGSVTVSSQRLYSLVELPGVGDHVLTLIPEAGVRGYAFTFG
ncbi:MAG TPA: cytochrome c biogenesis protein DipZ [Solirubrobacterales bacterium]|jgi:cytochrome c biogenesis protein CcdA/thiol-disulfide isomerase/thioredoxin|nr:cytochrome c biogenesis protein DipZ [Solirubrobacterales bacterium]